MGVVTTRRTVHRRSRRLERLFHVINTFVVYFSNGIRYNMLTSIRTCIFYHCAFTCTSIKYVCVDRPSVCVCEIYNIIMYCRLRYGDFFFLFFFVRSFHKSPRAFVHVDLTTSVSHDRYRDIIIRG